MSSSTTLSPAPTTLLYLEFSELAYELTPQGALPPGSIPSAWAMLPATFNLNGVVADAFINTETSQIVIAYRGSADLHDFGTADFDIYKGQRPPQFNDAETYASNLISEYKPEGFTFYVTGHSLGAAEAEDVAATDQIGGVGFAAPGATNLLLPTASKTDPSFTCYNIATDPVVVNTTAAGAPIGNVVTLAPIVYLSNVFWTGLLTAAGGQVHLATGIAALTQHSLYSYGEALLVAGSITSNPVPRPLLVFGDLSEIYNNIENFYVSSDVASKSSWDPDGAIPSDTSGDIIESGTVLVGGATVVVSETLTAAGATYFTEDATSGSETVLQSASISTSGSLVEDQFIVNGATIDGPASDAADLNIASNGGILIGIPGMEAGDEITLDDNTNGTVDVMIGGDSMSSLQTVMDLSDIDLSGDFIDISYASNGNVDLNFDIENGNTAVVDADSSLSDVVQDISFSGASGLLELNTAGSFNVYGAITGDYIELEGFTSGQILHFATANDPEFILLNSITGALTTIALPDYTGGPFGLGNLLQNGNLTIEIMRSSVACFAAGTRILTPRGEIAVEDLKEGDAVITKSGQKPPIKWIGKRRLDLSRHLDPETVRPIRFEADCFANDIPARDLFLSPDHALFIDGILVPAKVLLNGKNVSQPAVQSVTYHHIELEEHSVIYAENTPTETYLETGNRGAFENGADIITLHPDFSQLEREVRGCAPFVEAGPQVEAIRARLLERANIQTTQDPGLVVEYANGNAVIRSRYAVPGLITPDPRDRRRLGVKVASIIVGGRHISFDHPALAEGWHDCESDGRWTNGSAVIPAELLAGACDVSIIIAATVPYPVAA